MLSPALRPATGKMLKEIMQHQRLRGLYLPPSIAEALLQESGGVENFQNLDFLCYAGGPLAKAAGDEISKVTDICQIYGGTETGQIHQIFPSRDDWGYMEWHPAENLTMEPAEDDAYELIMDINTNSEDMSHLNHNFPNLTQYRTKDLFRSHPTKPNLWRFHGRTDDILVLSNGEKFNPVPMENIIQGHSKVSGVLVVGQGRLQAALLVEAKPEVSNIVALEESIWPLVEKGNTELPSQGRISRTKILIVGPDKPFQRAGKGTVVRKLTEKDFATEIEALYAESELDTRRNGPILKASYDTGTIQEFVHATVAEVFPSTEINRSHDLYTLGLDSLKTTEIASSLRGSLMRQTATGDISWLTSSIIYANPSIDQLSSVLSNFLNRGVVPEQESQSSMQKRIEKMSALVEKYTRSLPHKPLQIQQLRDNHLSIAIIGTTGSLGFQLLRKMVEDPRVTKIYCLNRASDAQEKFEKKLKELNTEMDRSKLVYFTIRLSENQLGLMTTQIFDLKTEIDMIVHNAWKVDFNVPLESFEDEHIRAVRSTIDLSYDGDRKPRVVFVSSVSSVGNWFDIHERATPIPESPLQDSRVASSMGYGESKNVTEQILHIASHRSGVRVTVLRLGQIAGSTKSTDPPWSELEWIPSLIKTSRALGSLPNDLPRVDWIPANLLADAMLELIHADVASGERERVYNLVNPRPVLWSSLLDTICQHMGPQIQLVSIKKWLNMLEQIQGIDQNQLSSKPALKLLHFFRSIRSEDRVAKYDTQHSQEVSEIIARLEGVKPEWMETWLSQWNF